MDEQTTNAGEMPETTQEAAAPAAAEMVTISAEELAKMRAALKGANAEAAKQRKALEQVEAERKQREEAEMTALDKANKRAAELEQQLAAISRKQMQSEVAAKVGLPAALASRLQGETLEELEADAAAILETLPKPTKPAPGIVATNPGANGSAAETREQKKARLMGTPGDIWTGGGINYPQG